MKIVLRGAAWAGRKRTSAVARLSLRADVAELVDAHGSGPCALRGVEVQVLSSASQRRRIGSPGCSIQRFLFPRTGGRSPAAGAWGSPTSTRAAASGWTRWPRLLQDVAIDDVQETGWGTPSHLWFVRRIRIDVHEPFLQDREVKLVTWCSGLAAIAAGRRWSLTGDAGGQAEVDSVWIHLDPDQRPARIEGFGVYGEVDRRAKRVDEARAAGSSARCAVGALASAGDRHRPARTSEQCDLLASGRARSGLEHPRSCEAAGGGARLPRADRRRRRDRSRHGSRRARGDRGVARVGRRQGCGARGRSIASPQAAPFASL